MSNTPAPFKQVDVTRAVKGAVAAGLSVGRVEIDRKGKIIVVMANGAELEKNEWDDA
jgi:hypothetical protein